MTCLPLNGFTGADGAGVGAFVGVFGFRLHCLHACVTHVTC